MYVEDDPTDRIDPMGTDSWTVSEPVAAGGYHTFTVVADRLGGPETARFSYGPDKGVAGALGIVPSKLTEQRGSNSITDTHDAAAWKLLSNPAAAAKAGITSVSIKASDAAVIKAGNKVDAALGTNAHPGPISYATLENSLSSSNTANSNSASHAVANQATGGNAKEPPGAWHPGWDQQKHVIDAEKR